MKRFFIISIFASLLLTISPVLAAGTPGCQIEQLTSCSDAGECKSRLVVTPYNFESCGETEASVRQKYGNPSCYGCCCNESGRDIVNGTVTTNKEKKPIVPSIFKAPDIKVSIPGMDKLEPVKCDSDNQNCSIPWIAKYIGALQKYAIGIIGIIAAITLMMGGVIWLTAAGNEQRIGEAKNWIVGSLTGLTLVLGSYLILYTINPELTLLKNININYLGKQDLPEVEVDTVELNKNIEETKQSGKVTMGNYCGCFNYKDSKSTTKLTTAESINEAIAYLSPSSPLKGKGQTILDAANKYGFDPALFVAKCKQENGLGTANSTIVQNMKNLASIMCGDTPGCKSHSCGTAKNGRKWRSYNSWEESIDDYFCFMKNSKVMGPSNSLRELITKYCPPCLYKGKCDCNTSQYIDGVASIMQKYNNQSFDSDKPNGSNCGCYDMSKHCSDRSTSYCTNYGK